MPRSALILPGLICIASGPVAIAQYIPVRKLDTNGLFAGEIPHRVRSDVAVGDASVSHALWTSAVLWDAATGSNVLPPLAGMFQAEARDFQVGGDVVGESLQYPASDSTATLWHNASPTDLNSLVTGGATMNLQQAAAIDSKGRIAGVGMRTNGTVGGYLFDGGVVTDLGILAGGTGGPVPTAMNEHLQIVGYADTGNFLHAVLWDNGTLTDLHDPAQISGDDSGAQGVDRFGRICGFAYFRSSATMQRPEAVLWDHGVVTDLGASLAGDSYANGLNDFGEIVGTCYDPVLGPRACIFANGSAIDLNTLIDPAAGWTLAYANDVDDDGQIVGNGIFGGQGQGFILEPDCKGTFTVYGTGCPGTGGVVPQLFGGGCPAPDRDFALAVADGLPNAFGFLFAGAGNGSLTIKPGCDLQVLPLILPPLFEALDGFGEQWVAEHLPNGTLAFDLYLQEFFIDPGAAFRISATAPLLLHFD
jgi:uncharacterized membrane protein